MRKQVLITGATGGLGRAFAWEFASRGWNLFLTDRSAAALATLSDGLVRAHGVAVQSQICDLADEADRRILVERIQRADISFGALVNVAGFDLEGAFLDRDRDGLLSLMRVNMEAGILLTHVLTETRCDWDVLRVINTSSLAAFFPMPYKALYSAAKTFILSASLALREELRGRATITVLCPAGMPTNPECIEAIRDQGLIGRITTMNTSDVARLTYKAAMRGRRIVIPGFVNQVMLAFSRMLPRTMVVSLIARRWGSARGYAGRAA